MKNLKFEKLISNLESNTQPEQKPLSFAEACIYLGVSRSHLYKLTSQQKITHYKPNNKMLYFLESDLKSYILRNRKKSETELEREANDYIQNRGK